MADCGTIFCGICDAQHTTKKADAWCPECEEGFCSECLNHHNVSKYTKSHEVISIENYKKLPPAVSNIVYHCPEHEKRYQNYCTKHESLCCPLCISTKHRECVGLLAIDELIKSSKTSTVFENMERSLRNMALNIEKVIKDREDNIERITNQRQKYQDEIKQMRKRINDHLDKLEEVIIKDINAAEKKITSETKDLLIQMKEKAKTIGELQDTLTTVKTYASDLQTFLSCKTLQADVAKEETFIQSLPDDDRLRQVSQEVKINDLISNFVSTITSFGSVSTAKSTSFTLTFEKEKEAQIFNPIKSISRTEVDTTNCKLKKSFSVPKGTCTTGITGCVITTTGKLILVDRHFSRNTNNRVLILNLDGILEDEVPLSISPSDVTNISDNRVAISMGSNAKMFIINTEIKPIKVTAKDSNISYGVTQAGGKLFYIRRGFGIHALDLKSVDQSTIVQDSDLSECSRITAYNNNIYFSNDRTNTVTCCKVTGERVWQFKDESVLVNPRGITVDLKLNVYVASWKNNSIVMISPDGSQCRQILGNGNGINNPLAIYFDRERNYLVVSNYNGKVFVYNVI